MEGSELFTPQVRLEDVVLAGDKKEALLTAVENFDKWQAACAEVGLTDVVAYGRGACLLFYGPSGTGKTMTAHAVANRLGKKILQVAVPTLDAENSRAVLQLIFREAKLSNAIIFFGTMTSRHHQNALWHSLPASITHCLSLAHFISFQLFIILFFLFLSYLTHRRV